MPNFTHKRLFVLFVLLGLIGFGVGLTGQAIVRAAAEPKTLDRDLEPAVIEGVRLSDLIGAPVDHLFVYTYSGTTLGSQIPVQIDEVAGGSYVTTEDGLLDTDDEIVFMAKDTGDRIPDTAALTTTLPISDNWYEIEVVDPTAPSKKGWAYLVRSGVLASVVTDDYADYNSTTQQVNAVQYDLGVTSTYAALDYLALNGSGVDILDQTKLRAVLEVFGVPTTITEEDLDNPGLGLIKDGPVRVLFQQAASSAGLQASASTVYKAYASLVQGTATISFTTNPSVNLVSMRTSADLDSGVSGAATFYNDNRPAGVSIDGSPDPVAETPLSKWFQVSHTTGRVIQVTDPTPVGGTQKNFYRDNSSPEVPDTGQPGSYGDSGFFIEGSINSMFTVQSDLFILPAAGGGVDNVGSTYEEYFFNPLLIKIGFQGAPPSSQIFLPFIMKS